MGAGKASEWIARLAETEPEAAHLANAARKPDDAYLEEHHMAAWNAFQTLRFDRQFGAMGGALPLSFTAIDTYARRYGIEGEAFDHLLILVRSLDAAWLERVNTKPPDNPGSGGATGGGNKA